MAGDSLPLVSEWDSGEREGAVGTGCEVQGPGLASSVLDFSVE